MGRVKKYKSIEDKKNANNIASKKYYWKNKETIDKRAKEKYYKNVYRICTQEKNG